MCVASLANVDVIVVALIVLVVFAGEMWWATARVSACRPTGINRRLRNPGDRHRVRLRGFRTTWNPATPLTQPLHGPGVATYWREGDQIRLDFQPGPGQSREFVGPLPDFAIPGTQAYQVRRKVIHQVLVVLVGYGAVVLAGCGVGFVATSGERWLWLYEHAGMYALANGLKFVNDDATQCTLNQGDNVKAIQYWVDLYKAGVLSQDVLLTGTGPERDQSFGNNLAAMFLGGFWEAGTLKADYKLEYPKDYGIVALEGSAGTGSATGGWIFTVTRDSKNPQEALNFIAWILGDADRLSKFTGLMPATSGAAAITLKDEFYQPFKKLLESPNTRHPIPLNPGLPEQAEVLRNVTQSAILGQMTAQQAADSFCQQIQGTLFKQ